MNNTSDPELTKGIFNLMNQIKKQSSAIEDLPEEIWKDVVGYEGLYKVSNKGRVKSLITNTILVPLFKQGYRNVNLYLDKHMSTQRVHRLVAKAFIPVPQELLDQGYTMDTLQINHKDENKKNNCVENLEWCTSEYNTNYGTVIKRRSEKLALPICCFDKNGNFVKKYDSISSVTKDGIDNSSVSACLVNNKRTSSYGYFWKYWKPEYKAGYVLPKEEIGEFREINYPVSCFDKDGNFIKTYSCPIEAAKTLNVSLLSLLNAVDKKYKSCSNMLWEKYKPEHIDGYKIPNDEIFLNLSCFDENGYFVKSFNSIAEAAKEMRCNEECIVSVLKNEYYFCKGYMWKRTKPEYVPGYKLPDSEIKLKGSLNTIKPVCCFDKNGNFMKKYDSVTSVTEDGMCDSSISACLTRNNRLSAYGCLWKYWKPEYKEGYQLPKDEIKPIRETNYPVSCFDKNGNFIKTYSCITKAAETLGVSLSTISGAVNKRQKSCSGMFWYKYKPEYTAGYKLSSNEIPKKEYISTRVSCFDENGYYIESFDSLTSAARAYKCDHKLIYRCLIGIGKSAKGVIWKKYSTEHIPGYKLPDNEITKIGLSIRDRAHNTRVTDTITNTSQEFSSGMDLEKYLHADRRNVLKYADTDQLFRGRYKIEKI